MVIFIILVTIFISNALLFYFQLITFIIYVYVFIIIININLSYLDTTVTLVKPEAQRREGPPRMRMNEDGELDHPWRVKGGR